MKFNEYVKKSKELQKKTKRKIAAIDFDSVLHSYREGWKDGIPYDDPVPGAKEALEELRRRGYLIYIHSARFAPDMTLNYPGYVDPEQVKLVTDYLNKHKIPFDALRPKIYADIYVDDRAIRCNPLKEPEYSWDNVLKTV